MKSNFYKTISAFVLLGAVAFNFSDLKAQSYTISAKKSSTTVPCSASTDYLISVINTGTSDLTLSWKGISNSLPNCWTYTICDWDQCYPKFPMNQKNPRAVHPQESVTFKYTMTVTDTGGTGITKLILFPTNNPSKTDTIQVTFNGCTTGIQCPASITGINEASAPKANLTISPNPAREYVEITVSNINLSSNSKVDVYNIIGSKLMTVNIDKEEVTRLNITELPAGLYFIKYSDKAGSNVTKRFNKVN